MNENTGSVEHLLQQELDCFHRILDMTQGCLDSADPLTNHAIMDLLQAREEEIRQIKFLENQRKSMPHTQENYSQLKHEINHISRLLVAIDTRIYDILYQQKMNTAKDLAKLAENRKGGVPNYRQNHIVDIQQE